LAMRARQVSSACSGLSVPARNAAANAALSWWCARMIVSPLAHAVQRPAPPPNRCARPRAAWCRCPRDSALPEHAAQVLAA
jgi:hypothetical protein